MRTLWLLHELGLPFDLQTYPFDASIKTPDYLALSPAGRVPALEIDGVVIFESGAAAEYLCERFSPDVLGRSPDHAERAAWLNWVHFAETISQHCAALTQQHVALFEDHMRSTVVMKIEAKRLAKTLDVLNDALGMHPYLLPTGFSAADIGTGQAVYMGQHFVRLDAFEHLSDWFARLSARPAFQAALPKGPGLYAKDFYPPWEQKQ